MKKLIDGILLITQLGITMMTPIFLSIYIGYKLDEWLSTNYWFLIFLVLGFLAAFRNAYYITKKYYQGDKKDKEL